MAQPGLSVKVKQTGRIKPPNLDNGALTQIGRSMVIAQKLRWSKSLNASGNKAKPLSKKYTFIKKNYLRVNVPQRDLKLTGVLTGNFQLRKAINGQIRAENTTRSARKHALQADKSEQMIGFAGSDQRIIFAQSQIAYGRYLQRAWVTLRG